ncbi:hypothetical protein VNI00_015008 [Paramarasmius palmivorus]|uniref:Uncharacterized protein n=1 Tax=Paramarasmius palmivorus TaxID=297713 RepID=A0AAW0BPT7_9AGAR
MAGFDFSPTLTCPNMIWHSCATFMILSAFANAFSFAPFPTTITQGIPFTITWIREPEETQSFMIIKSAVGVPPVSSPRYFLVTATAGQTEGTVLVSFPTNTYAFVLDAVQIDGNGNPLSTFYTGTQTLAVIATGEIASQFVPTSVTTGSSSVTPISVLSGLPSPTSSQSFSSTPANRKPVGAIVGGAVGGICLSLFLSLVGLYLLRRRRKQKQIAQLTNAQDLYRSSEITPFTERRSSKRILSNSNSHAKSIPEPTSPLHTSTEVDNTNIRESSRNDFDTTIYSRTSRPGHRPPTDFDSIPSSEIAEMVRALYQRMWNPERDERPPAYEARV